MHFLAGLLFLIAIVSLVLAYPVVFYLIAVGCQRARHRYRLRYSLDRHAVLQKKLWPVFPKAGFKKITILVSAILCLLYVQQRIKWMGEDNANLTAKEYFVAGQVLAGIRFAVVRVQHPENPLVLPLNALQKAIYRQGIKHLPVDDGEIGVWTDLWLLYPYNLRLRLPYFVDVKSDKPSPKMRRLLDQCWFALEKMATGTYADRQIKIEHYYRNFPALAVYYETYDGFYADRYIGSARVNLKKEGFVSRLETLLTWLDDLGNRWRQDGVYEKIVTEHPIVEAYRRIIRLSILQELLSAIIFKGRFKCDHVYVNRLHDEYVDLLSEDIRKNYLLNLYSREKSRQQTARNFYVEHVYSSRGNFGKVVLKNKCFKKFPEETMRLIDPETYEFRRSGRNLDSTFREEYKILEQQMEY